MRDVHIMVEFELMRSDGNYGRDRAICQLSGTLDADDDIDENANWLLDRATRNVEGRLSRSASLEVRRTMLRKPRLCPECKKPLADVDDYYHPACEDTQRERRAQAEAERRAKWEAERIEHQAEYQRQREIDGDTNGDEVDELEDVPL